MELAWYLEVLKPNIKASWEQLLELGQGERKIAITGTEVTNGIQLQVMVLLLEYGKLSMHLQEFAFLVLMYSNVSDAAE